MFLALGEDERAIVDATREAIDAEAPPDRWFRPDVDAASEETRLLGFGAQMGWIGFAAPADAGGSEASLVDEVLVFRQLGARLAPVGLLAGAMAVEAAHRAGDAALARRISAGEVRVGLALERGAVLFGAAGAELGLTIDGETTRLLDVVDAAPLGLGLDGMTTRARLPAQSEAVVSLADADLALRTRLLLAAALQGLAETALEQANGYAKMREQFGRPIGSFQAVRHRVADMEVRARRAEALLYFAAVRLRDGAPDRALQVDAALALASEAARTNAEANIASHGAIGVTVENIGHLLLKRAKLWTLIAGGETLLLERVADASAPAL